VLHAALRSGRDEAVPKRLEIEQLCGSAQWPLRCDCRDAAAFIGGGASAGWRAA